MSRQTSVYLDAVRFAAALIVLLSHLGEKSWSGGLGWQLTPLGAPAVDIFFVLSGYVIAYVVATKESDIYSYTISRVSRLYSVCIPVVLLTATLALAGRWINPQFDVGDASPLAYLSSLSFTNQLWHLDLKPGNDAPYWSLGYEAAYYVIFAAMVFPPKPWRFMFTIICCLCAGPRILMMMPVWLAGAFAYFAATRSKLGAKSGMLLWVLTAAVLAWMAKSASSRGLSDPEATAAFLRPITEWQAFAVDYAIGALAAVNFVAFQASSALWTKVVVAVERPIRWLAGATFTIYLAHYPIARFLIQTSPWPVGSAQEQAEIFVGTLVGVFVLAHYTERRKQAWRHAVQLLVTNARRLSARA